MEQSFNIKIITPFGTYHFSNADEDDANNLTDYQSGIEKGTVELMGDKGETYSFSEKLLKNSVIIWKANKEEGK